MTTDYACFAIWEHGLTKQDEIVADLHNHFDVLCDFMVHWSDEHYNQNIARLYEHYKFKPFKKYNRKIGKPPFRFLIVRDNDSQYAYEQSVSGVIEPCNSNITKAKYLYRSWFEKPYLVHSSNNEKEFFFQAPLILGSDLYEKVLAGDFKDIRKDIHQDLAGAGGWDSWHAFFKIMNYANNYVVLRGFEGLPDHFNDADLDVLTDDFQRFASTANIIQSDKYLYKGGLRVNTTNVHVDIRFVGDHYYPSVWANDILDGKTPCNDSFYIPQAEQLFFSLLYHCSVHKLSFKQAHQLTLENIAKDRGFDWFTPDIYEDSERLGRLLKGYMHAHNYYYEAPVDHRIELNKQVVKMLPHAGMTLKKKTFKQRLFNLPKKIKAVLKR